MRHIQEIIKEVFSPLNLSNDEKDIKDFCKNSDNIEDLQAYRKERFHTGRTAFIYLIDDRIEELRIKTFKK